MTFVNCCSSFQFVRLCRFMLLQTLSGVYYVANLASEYEEFIVTSKGWCSSDSCPDQHLLTVGRLSISAEICAAEEVLAAGMLL